MPKKSKKPNKRKSKTSSISSKPIRVTINNEPDIQYQQGQGASSPSDTGTEHCAVSSSSPIIKNNPAKIESSEKTIRWLLLTEESNGASKHEQEEELYLYKSERRKRYEKASDIAANRSSSSITLSSTTTQPCAYAQHPRVYAQRSSILVTKMPSIYPTSNDPLGAGRLKTRLVQAL